MSKHVRWLEAESERWVAEAIITREQAERIRGRYAPSAPPIAWGLVVFFGLGAIIIGLGIILLLAYNWSEIPKAGKLAVIFGSLIAAHVSGFRLQLQRDWRQRLGEALSLLGTMLFGAGIWLIAQIYNIDEHFPNGFLLWALGAVALAWALDSVPQAILAAILLAVWGGSETMSFSAPVDWSSVLLFVTVAPLAWRHRSPLLTAVVLAALYWLLLCNAAEWGGAAAAFGNAIGLSVLLLAVEKHLRTANAAPELLGVVRFFGLLGFVVCAYLLSFHDIVGSLLEWPHQVRNTAAQVYHWLLFALAVVAWLALLRGDRKAAARSRRPEEWLFPIALLYSQAMGVWGAKDDAEFVAGVFNLVCLGVATAWMVHGCRRTQLGLVVRGSVLLACIVFARYFDLFDSLAARGLVFLFFGGVLFAEGFFYRRVRATGEGES